MRIDGKRALIVGGGGGLGSAIADLFTEAGAACVVADRNFRNEARHPSVTIDVTQEADTKRAVSEANEILGGIDILVNSAGILTQAEVVEMSLSTWRDTIDIDLTGVFLTTREVLPQMIERQWGRIINIASQLGIKGGRSLAHYSAAKAGVIALTKSLALEVSEHNVLVNAIAPGPFESPFVAGISPEWKAAKLKELPLGRFGTPEEVAPTALLLASDPGGNVYVGQTLGPNSGDVMP